MSSQKCRVLLLGASGSIGGQAIDIINEGKDKFELVAFSVGKNFEKAREILMGFNSIKRVFVSSKEDAKKLHKEFPNVVIYYGDRGLAKLTHNSEYDMCVNALVGIAGFEPSVIALKKNKILCLANKEALVAGGTVINRLLSKGKGKLYPIDSEHVALAKCLANCKKEDVKRLIITASGGALRNIPIEELKDVRAEQALKHPTWKMGNKITIDCATMMNKGFEVIEAYYLYGYPLDRISIIMHDESLVHSMVELNDGSLILEYSKPDMHNPIRWAMYQGKNNDENIVKIKSLEELKDCHFHEYDSKRYPCTELAKQALTQGATKMIALNASNEVLVNKYLRGEIGFLQISEGVKMAVDKVTLKKNPNVFCIRMLDKRIRKELE